jgi:hypothetical protein
MLHFYSRPLFGGDRFTDTDDLMPAMGGFIPTGSSAGQNDSADRAVDAALRNVPLPEGLMVRMSQLAVTLTDDSPDQAKRRGR